MLPSRALIALAMPITVALLIGILIGTYVIAPIVEPGPATSLRQPGASSGASAVTGSRGASGSSGAASSARAPGSSSGTIGSAPPAASGQPATSAAPGGPVSVAPSSAPSALPAAKEGVVPILYYHRVEGLPKGFSGWSKKSQDTFLVDDLMPYALIAQLDWLKNHGYTTILPADLAAHWDTGKSLPKRPIILTFDDGFRDWRAFMLPELKKRKMVAEFYVVVANVGRSISWDDVRALAKAGMGIGAHDVQHFQLAGGGVTAASPGVMRYQVGEAKRRIEQNVGVKVDAMAYVGGGFNDTLIAIVKEAGYTTARSIQRGVLQTPGIRHHLHVSRVSWHDDVTDLYTGRMVAGLPTFAKRVSGQNPG